MRILNTVKTLSLIAVAVAPLLIASPVYAAEPNGAAQANNFLTNMINIVAGFAGTIATGALVWGGIMYMVSGGDLQKLDKSKAIIKFAAVGLVIVIAAVAITNFLSGQAKSSFGG